VGGAEGGEADEAKEAQVSPTSTQRRDGHWAKSMRSYARLD
jgi:hypothetical protein